MAQAPITAEIVTEAGIAAHLAANPNLLPPEISELSDQAAIFASNNTNAFMFTGAADADSENTNFGESLATKAIENVIRLEAERRKEDDPATDASMIAEAGAAHRERLERMREVSYRDGTFFMYGMEIDEEDLDAEMAESASEIDAHSAKYGWDGATAAQMAILYSQWENATGEEKTQLFERMREVGGEQWAEDRAREANERQAGRPRNEATAAERADARASNAEPSEEWAEEQASFAEGIGYDTSEAADFGERAEEVGNGTSLASSVSPESMFDMAAYNSPSEEFNLQGLGGVRVAEAESAQLEQNQTQSGPAFGVRA